MNRKHRRLAAKSGAGPERVKPAGRNGPDPIGGLFAAALAHHREGRLALAAAGYREILALDPDHGESLHLSGLLALAGGRADLAVGLIGRAIAIKGGVARLHSDLGLALHALGRFEEAATCYRNALDLAPAYPEALSNLGNALQALGLGDQAIACYRQALALLPDLPVVLCNLATALHERGDLSEAIARYRQALALRPNDPMTLSNLAAALIDAGCFADAVTCCGQSLALRPDHPEALSNQGIALKALGRIEEAVACYRGALSLKPDYPDALSNLGIALRDLGQAEAAIDCYRRALALKPDYPEALSNLGVALHDRGRDPEAIACLERALALRPAHPEAAINLGVVLEAQGRVEEAAGQYRAALELRPASPVALSNLGNALRRLDRLDEAAACLERAVALAPESVEALINLGAVFQARGEVGAAHDLYRRALDVRPDSPEALTNLANVLADQDRTGEAMDRYHQALALRADAPETLCGLGLALQAEGRLEEALARFVEARDRRPEYAEAHWNEAFVRLLQGDMTRGWPGYEWRWRKPEIRPHGLAEPLWDGAPLDGCILLHHEQGFGDSLQFIRYAPLVKARCRRVVLLCPPTLASVLGTAQGLDQVLTDRRQLPAFACHAPLPSLPLIFGTTLATIPADIPYLQAPSPPAPVTVGAGLRVGLVWRGSPKHRNDRNRSMTAARMATLCQGSGVSWYGLQPDLTDAERACFPPGFYDLGSDLDDWSRTAAAVAGLDLIITVDTAVAHLAGALGRPAWLLLPFAPDWRWLLARDDSPWYPSLRLFRQPRPGDWPAVLAAAARALARVLAGECDLD